MMTIALFLAAAAAAAAPAPPADGIEQLAWIAGCWASTDPARGVEEQWMSPRGGTMLGIGRTVRGGKLVEYELIVLREEDGRLAYQAHPSGQPSAVFLSKEVTPVRVIFENLQHDFPQRVGYERSGDGSMTAWIEGTSKGALKRVEFPYTRAACGGAR